MLDGVVDDLVVALGRLLGDARQRH